MISLAGGSRPDTRPPALFVAVDGGPRETLAPLAAAWGGQLADTRDAAGLDEDYWWTRISASAATLLVVGTSESARGRAIELAARRAACRLGVAVAAVEDYPGNFHVCRDAGVDALFVESPAAAELAHRRHGDACPPLFVISPARYDALRNRHSELRRGAAVAEAEQRSAEARLAILWVGQPETDEALVCLQTIVPAVVAGDCRLHFRAHPRDAGRAEGAYGGVAEALGSRFLDVSDLSVAETFALAPRLLLTQYSSMMVDAGFYGIPSLCLILPGAAAESLERKKGYRLPLPCLTGAAAVAQSSEQFRGLLQPLLHDESLRSRMRGRFDSYYAVGMTTSSQTIVCLESLVSGRSSQGHGQVG